MDDLLRDFITEAREGIEALDSELVRFEQNPENPELLGEIFRLIHTIKGTCGFIGLARLQAVAHAAETVLGGFRDHSVAVSGEAVSAVLEAVDVIRGLIETLSRTGLEPEGADTALIARLDACVRSPAEAAAPAPEAPPEAPPGAGARSAPARPLLERAGGEATLDVAAEMALAASAEAPDGPGVFRENAGVALQIALRDGLVDAARGLTGTAELVRGLDAFAARALQPADVEAVLAGVRVQLLALDVAPADADELLALVRPEPEPEPVRVEEPAPPEAAPLAGTGPAPPEGEAAGPQTIRVSVESLEHLMTVASELVLIRNQLLQILRLETESPFEAPLHRLNQVTSELQEGVMTARMQPISGAWAKLPRLVRDLARDLGKKIDLQLEGQDTELDRQVLELIKDPLTHMIRNAADHGVETPEERRRVGKPETGRIRVSARHEGGAIVIEMRDDGRGLSPGRIRAKAVASGLLSAAQAEAMGDAEAQRLIFLPGFSTAKAVTAVSGRGVGMDVVRTNIEKIGGAIELESEEGRGSHFTIRIPLTLTIVSALIVECCGERFAMPQSSVVELVSASDASLHTIEYINGAAVLRLRDRLLPLVSLQTVLELPPEDARKGETCIVVARVGAFTFGVIVDRVFDTEEIVVKPTSTVLRHLRAYSGATILGDGSVIMILDFKGISPDAGAAVGAAALETEERRAVETSAILLFRGLDESLKAAPLASVARIEEISPTALEAVQGRTVLQYRGRLMPVVGLDGRPAPREAAATRPLLVFARGERSVGLLVEEIVDIVESSLSPELRPDHGGAAVGSLIIEGRATELIDVDFYWRAGMEEAPAGPPDVAAPAPRRVLVLDRSPFSQLLLQPLLARAGYEAVVAPDPETALRLHERGERFDLIVADAGLSAADGRGFAQALAGARAWHGAPMLSLGLSAAGAGGVDPAELLDAMDARIGAGLEKAA